MNVEGVLVTGGCGFVGSRIVEHLRQQYPACHVTVLDMRIPSIDEQLAGVSYVRADIISQEQIQSVFDTDTRSFQAVIHCASISPPLSERYARRIEKQVFRVNVDGTRAILQAAKKAGIKAFVYTSSICVVTDDFSQSYPNIDERWPLVERGKASTYGESKAEAETLVLAANSKDFKTCALRLSVVFGEGDTQFLPQLVRCITHKNESPYRLGDGTNLWDTVYVGNVADAHILAMKNLTADNPTAAGEAIFITNQEPVSSRDFMLQTWKQYNGHIPPFEIGIPVQLGWGLGLLCEVYARITGVSTAISRGSVQDATAMRYTNASKAINILDYHPGVGLEEGLRRSCKWLSARSKT